MSRWQRQKPEWLRMSCRLVRLRMCWRIEANSLVSLRKTSLGRKSATENSTVVYHAPPKAKYIGKSLFIHCLELSILLLLTNGDTASAWSWPIKTFQKGASGFSISFPEGSLLIMLNQNGADCFLHCMLSSKCSWNYTSLFCHCCPQKYMRQEHDFSLTGPPTFFLFLTF